MQFRHNIARLSLTTLVLVLVPLFAGCMCHDCQKSTYTPVHGCSTCQHPWCHHCDYGFANQCPDPCNPCTPYQELPAYGYTPTCWQRWPSDWIGCPPVDSHGGSLVDLPAINEVEEVTTPGPESVPSVIQPNDQSAVPPANDMQNRFTFPVAPVIDQPAASNQPPQVAPAKPEIVAARPALAASSVAAKPKPEVPTPSVTVARASAPKKPLAVKAPPVTVVPPQKATEPEQNSPKAAATIESSLTQAAVKKPEVSADALMPPPVTIVSQANTAATVAPSIANASVAPKAELVSQPVPVAVATTVVSRPRVADESESAVWPEKAIRLSVTDTRRESISTVVAGVSEAKVVLRTSFNVAGDNSSSKTETAEKAPVVRLAPRRIAPAN
ncbi:MAG: hypothetical protein SGJ20_18220 [Planctomycetota bacterium]|nr:hypothetical protein [Planctomycetota bacterium]